MRTIVGGLIATSLFAAIAAGQPAPPTLPLPPRDQFHLFVLAGQSNMAGRGVVAADDRQPHPRVLVLTRDGDWAPAVDPLHFDKPDIVGVGPGRAFGMAVAEAMPGITVGLIPVAVGGSPIDAWQPGAFDAATKTHPWDDAMTRVQRARRDGAVKAVLWHQGESDATPARAPAYASKLHALIERWRTALDAPTLPVVIGQMGRFEAAPWDVSREMVDRAHRELPAAIPGTAFVHADGLAHKGDAVHFDAASARTLGRRYAEAYLALTAR